MASRFDGRIKRLEAMQGDDVESILDELDGYQSQAILMHLIAHLEGEDGPSDERLRQTPLQPRARYEQVLASIPEGTFERLFAAFLERVARKEARAA
jgi:hypothetical protein